MKQLGLRALMNRKYRHRKKTVVETAPDRLQRKFQIDSPNKV